jgi:hypothetical protein
MNRRMCSIVGFPSTVVLARVIKGLGFDFDAAGGVALQQHISAVAAQGNRLESALGCHGIMQYP